MASYLVLLVQMITNIITVVLILNALMSFAPLDPWHPARRFLSSMAEPLVRPFRNLIPPVGMFDLSTMVALFAYQIAGQLIIALIVGSFS